MKDAKSEGANPRYGCGAVIQSERDSRYYHIVNRYRDIDHGCIKYRYWGATHTHDYHSLAEDLHADFRPAGITINPGVKPAAVFGGRIDGMLVGWRSIWGKYGKEAQS